MIIGIVGAEAAKFTPETEALARTKLREIVNHAELVISGRCHLGGIDLWAIEEAKLAGIPTKEFPPKTLRWEGGYKQRNLLIAEHSDVVVCITVKELPESFNGEWRFPQGCYHCKTPPEDHVKSGGCWTVKQAAKMGKRTKVIVI